MIGEKLKAARTEKGISIEDISASTHINKQYLIDIENDVPLRMPETYRRAFIRSFAMHVGLDPDELFESVAPEPVTGQSDEKDPDGRSQAPMPAHTALASADVAVPVKQHQFRVLFILLVVIILGLVGSILFLQHQHRSTSVEEISFPDVVKEKEQTAPVPAVDSLDRSSPARRVRTTDSLTLEVVSVDTVWLSLLIDSSETKEYTLPPQHRLKWKAVHSFLVTTGNAGSVYFTLNGQHLGTLGQGNKPIKDFLLTKDVLQKKDKISTRTGSDEKR